MKKVIILGCMLSLLIAALAAAGCGGGSSGNSGTTSQTPEKAAAAFWKASLTGDADTSWSLLSKQLQSSLKNKEAWASSGVSNTLGNSKVVAGKATIKGDEATVKVKIMNGDEELISQDVQLVKENGEWKVAMP